jgi:hypothetical protein
MLGTSSWGTKVNKTEAYRILELFYSYNFRWIDTSTNYPINKIPENYGQTVDWLADFCNDFPELKIFVKVGSANNLGNSEQLLNSSYLALIFDVLFSKFSVCLGGMGIHWDHDNKKSDREEIINQFLNLQGQGLEVGLSGLRQTRNYCVNEVGYRLPWLLQLNISPVKATQVEKDIELHKNAFPKARIYGYNFLGGIKSAGIPTGVERLNFLSSLVPTSSISKSDSPMDLLMNYFTSLNIDGMIIGPTTKAQCQHWCTTTERFGLV